MFTRIASIAAAALLATAAAAPAHADKMFNGAEMNGRSPNGLSFNGAEMNGRSANGLSVNGKNVNGRTTNGSAIESTGFAIDGIDLPAAQR